MIKRLTPIVLISILALLLVGVISAQSLPGSGWWFGATHQNVGSSTANVVYTAYDSSPGSPYTLAGTLAAGASTNVGPGDIPGLPAGFEGAMVTSSDQVVVALVNITNRLAGGNGVSGGLAAAIYSGVDSANSNTALDFPLVKNGHFNKTTTFFLQNAGSSATTINTTFHVNGTDYPYVTPSVSPGHMVSVDPGLAGVPSGNGNVGAMSLTASQPIAGAMLEHESAASVAKVLQGSSAVAPGELDQTVYCPTYKQDHFGRQSGIQVQNAHSTAQDITVEFVGGGGPYTSTKTNVAAGASVTFIDDPNILSGTLFSAKVEGSLGNVAAIVNESELPLVNPNQTSTTYNCQAASTASNNLSYPAYKELWFGRTSALQIQNVDTSTATDVVLTFTDNNGNVRTTTAQTIAPGASNVYVCVSGKPIWSGTALASSTLSGVTVASASGKLLVAVANEASWATTSPCIANNGAGSFDKSTSNSFNQ